MDRQDTRTLARGAGVTLPGRVLGRAMAMLTQVLLARLLGPAIFGLYSLGYALLRLGELILPLGMDQGVVRFGARGEDGRTEVWQGVIPAGIGVALLMGALAGGGLFFMAPYFAEIAFHDPAMEGVLKGIALALAVVAVLRGVSRGKRPRTTIQQAA